MITRKKIQKKQSEKTKIIVSILAASTIAVTSTSIAFGEADVSTLLSNWYHTKMTEEKNKITEAAIVKTEVEKANLIEQIRTDIEVSASEIVLYSEQKSAEIQLAIEQKRKELEEEMIKKNSEDKNKVKDEIDQSTEAQIEEIKKDKDNKKSDDQVNDSKNENEQSIDHSKKQEEESKDKPKN